MKWIGVFIFIKITTAIDVQKNTVYAIGSVFSLDTPDIKDLSDGAKLLFIATGSASGDQSNVMKLKVRNFVRLDPDLTLDRKDKPVCSEITVLSKSSLYCADSRGALSYISIHHEEESGSDDYEYVEEKIYTSYTKGTESTSVMLQLRNNEVFFIGQGMSDIVSFEVQNHPSSDLSGLKRWGFSTQLMTLPRDFFIRKDIYLWLVGNNVRLIYDRTRPYPNDNPIKIFTINSYSLETGIDIRKTSDDYVSYIEVAQSSQGAIKMLTIHPSTGFLKNSRETISSFISAKLRVFQGTDIVFIGTEGNEFYLINAETKDITTISGNAREYKNALLLPNTRKFLVVTKSALESYVLLDIPLKCNDKCRRCLSSPGPKSCLNCNSMEEKLLLEDNFEGECTTSNEKTGTDDHPDSGEIEIDTHENKSSSTFETGTSGANTSAASGAIEDDHSSGRAETGTITNTNSSASESNYDTDPRIMKTGTISNSSSVEVETGDVLNSSGTTFTTGTVVNLTTTITSTKEPTSTSESIPFISSPIPVASVNSKISLKFRVVEFYLRKRNI